MSRIADLVAEMVVETDDLSPELIMDMAWRLPCPISRYECISCVREAIELIHTTRARIDTSPAEDLSTDSEDIVLRVEGGFYRCACGCNVFRRAINRRYQYRCNACGNWYEGDPVDDEDCAD